MADGWLSTAKAHVILRAIEHLPGNPEIRERGVQVCSTRPRGSMPPSCARPAGTWSSVVDPDGQARREEKELKEERAAHLDRGLSFKDDGAGGVWIYGRCTSEYAATIKAALFPLAAPHPTTDPVCDPNTCDIPGCSHDGRDPRDHGARLMDALYELCRPSPRRGEAAHLPRHLPPGHHHDGLRGPARGDRVRDHRDR